MEKGRRVGYFHLLLFTQAVSSSLTDIKISIEDKVNTYCDFHCKFQIQKPALYCFDENSITIRGQAELTSTPYLEKWVKDSGSTTFNILGYNLTVDHNCMVTISSLDEVGCGSLFGGPSQTTSTQLPVAVGVAAAVVLLLIIAVIAVLAMVLNKRKKSKVTLR